MGTARPRSSSPAVLFELVDSGRVALVTLNRPACLNAYDRQMRDGLFAAFGAVRDDPAVMAMILCGNGPAFCSGGDLREFGTAPSPTRARQVRWLRDVWGLLWTLPAITIAAVHGFTVGGGLEMALLCDQCIAADDARFALPETGLGMIPGVGGTQTLPRLVGVGRALHVVLTGTWFDARQAHAWGIASRVVPRQRLLEAARATARRVLRVEPRLLRQLKRAVNDGGDMPLAAGLRLEQALAGLTI